jgi:hypothetical protein
LVTSLLQWVMTNSYVQFAGQTYKQIQGTAMGTPVAPAFATLFMSSLDLEMNECGLNHHIRVHKRFIDDGFVAWEGSKDTLLKWLERFNNLVDQIKLTWHVSEVDCDFMDLHLFKGARFSREQVLDVSTFQKQLNCYLYIPAGSYHPLHCKSGFITSELKRYLLRSTQEADYRIVQQQFYDRLKARGYSKEFLLPLFSTVPFCLRTLLMQEARQGLLPGPLSLSPTSSTPSPTGTRPLVLKLDYEPRAQHLHSHLRSILRDMGKRLHAIEPHVFSERIITAWMVPKNLKKVLVKAQMD